MKNGRSFIGIELNPEYIEITKSRYETSYPVERSIAILPVPNEEEPVASINSLFEGGEVFDRVASSFQANSEAPGSFAL